MASSSGQVVASGDQRSSSTVPVISAISEAGDRKDTPAHFVALANASRPDQACDGLEFSWRCLVREGVAMRTS